MPRCSGPNIMKNKFKSTWNSNMCTPEVVIHY